MDAYVDLALLGDMPIAAPHFELPPLSTGKDLGEGGGRSYWSRHVASTVLKEKLRSCAAALHADAGSFLHALDRWRLLMKSGDQG